MSIFTAELKKGKKVDEDALASRVFGVLDILDKGPLKKFILEVFPEIQKEKLSGLKIEFWKTYEGGGFKREPDIVISNEDGSILIFIELKKGRSPNVSQLYEEFIIGKNKCDDFYLVCITDHVLEPDVVKEVRNKLGVDVKRMGWRSWRWVNTFFKENAGIPHEDKELPKKVINSLNELLEHLGYGDFMGLTEEELKKLKTMIGLKDVHKRFLEEVQLFCDKLEGRLENISIKWMEREREKISRDGHDLAWDYKKWISTYLWVGWADKNWNYDGKFDFDESSHLYTVFWLDRDEIYVGYYGDLKEIKDLESIEEKIANELKSISDKYSIFVYNFSAEWESWPLDKTRRDNPENCSFRNLPEDVDKFEVYYRIKIDEFAKENREMLIKKVSDMLCALRDMANKLFRGMK